MSVLLGAGLRPEPSDVASIVGDVFCGLLGTDEVPVLADHAGSALPVKASVGVSGEWSAQVAIACSEPMARMITGQLLALPADAVTDDDVRDVAGELANVIGGNVKSVMPGPSVLSLPRTSLRGELPRAVAPLSLRMDFIWAGEPLRVTVRTEPDDHVHPAQRAVTEERDR